MNDFHAMNKREVPPFGVFLGEVKEFRKDWVILKNEIYEFNDPYEAIESCYKAWSSVTDFLWLFSHIYIYNMSNSFLCQLSYRSVNVFIDSLKKFK